MSKCKKYANCPMQMFVSFAASFSPPIESFHQQSSTNCHKHSCLSLQSTHPEPKADREKGREGAREKERESEPDPGHCQFHCSRHASTRHSIEYQCVHPFPSPPSLSLVFSASCFLTLFIICACLLEPDKAHAPPKPKQSKAKRNGGNKSKV